jgi:hypothetical protein
MISASPSRSQAMRAPHNGQKLRLAKTFISPEHSNAPAGQTPNGVK